MRSMSLSKSVLVAALGCIVLSACGAQKATTDQALAGSASSATTPPDVQSTENDQELRFLELTNRVTLACAPDLPGGSGDGGPPRPEDLTGWEEVPAPRYGPGETPPGVPDADGGIPVPLPSDVPAPPASAPSPAKPVSVEEVPLTAVEKCSGDEHAKRVGEAFKGTRTAGYQVMHKKLESLGYPAYRIHRMPDHAGAPRVRLDLRVMGGHEALEVTGTGSGVVAEPFGAPETEDVKLADVKRKPKPKLKSQLDAPTS
ncbi:hypothetical protein [Streptomyces sp. NPDC000410]|uniref:hypothetical protein n=1 Tax=Streptomyces sp. NPDC000410 TaxID=3154254 RepID=UPI0033285DCF